MTLREETLGKRRVVSVALNSWRYRFILDVWAEPRELENLPAIVRARVRDTTSEEAAYVGSIAEITRIIDRRLDAEGVAPRVWEREQ